MKTNSILLATLVFAWTLLPLSTTHAAAVEPLSSGIKQQAYTLEWCSPHHERLANGTWWTTICKMGSFQDVSGVATVQYNGTTYANGNVGALASGFGITRTSQSGASMTDLVGFFNVATSGAFALEWEWVLTIRTYMTDYADNTSFYKMVYKIDKTAPDLTFRSRIVGPSITEGSPNAYYEWEVNTSATVTKNDSVDRSSNAPATNSPAYASPLLSDYKLASASPRAIHTRTLLPAYYFRFTDLNTFTLNVLSSDTYGAYLDNVASSNPLPDGYTGSLISGVSSNYALVTSASVVSPLTGIPTPSNALLTSNPGWNSQSTYRLRLYDNTVDAWGLPASWNYSETAFYAVRDNTPPNRLVSESDNKLAIERLLRFGDNLTTVWDKTTTNPTAYNPEIAGAVSRFIAANAAQTLYSNLSDVGIGSSPSADMFNAGLDRSGGLRLDIEQSALLNSYDPVFTYWDRWTNVLTRTKNFSNVDLARTNGYRKYKTQMSALCDLVGNCLDPKLEFRVVAAWLDKNASTLAITGATQSVPWKVIANGSDSYKLSYTLNDVYYNRIVPVVAPENGWAQIKNIDSTINFQNGLFADQKSNTPSGAKLVTAADLEIDNSTFTNNINIGGAISMKELPNTNNGIFSISLVSKVPTRGMYPYLSANSTLNVTSIVNTASGSAPAGSTYPPVGYFNDTTSPAGSTNIITYNSGGIAQSLNNLGFIFDDTNYGNVTGGIANFTNLGTTYKAFLEFASPAVYGLENMTLGTLTNSVFVSHTKKLFTLGGVTPRLYEKILVAYKDTTPSKFIDTNGKDGQPGVIDFSIRTAGSTGSGTLINPGACSSGPCAITNMFGTAGTPVGYPFSIGNSTNVEIAMSPIPSRMPYINSNIHKGYVSALMYNVGSDLIQLPSVARDILNNAWANLNQYDMTRAYFDDAYKLDFSTGTVQNLAVTFNDIAITGLSNRYNGITTGTGGTKGNVNIGKELTRMDLVTTIKKNVAILSAGFGPSAWKKWCANATTIDQYFINNDISSPSKDCTQIINGETISFIDGNATIACDLLGDNICHIANKRSIIVKNGSLYVKSNITTIKAGAQTAGQLFLWVMNDAGLTNVTVNVNNPTITDASYKGWLFIDPRITNIDAFLFAQGPMVSYSDNPSYSVFYGWNTVSAKSNTQLRNQLHIMGSLLTLNKIGEANTPKCPYIVANCTTDTAPIFDLINFRNFQFTSLSTYDEDATHNSIMSPWYPTPPPASDGQGDAKTSGGLGELEEPAWSGTITCDTSAGTDKHVWLADLRCITDRDYRGYPMLIERDLRWNTNRSEFFRAQN